MRDLTHGLMAPLAELWIVIGAPLDRSNLGVKLTMSERVARFWPANAVLARRAVFLALDGKEPAGGPAARRPRRTDSACTD